MLYLVRSGVVWGRDGGGEAASEGVGANVEGGGGVEEGAGFEEDGAAGAQELGGLRSGGGFFGGDEGF